MVEQRSPKPKVEGSIPSSAATPEEYDEQIDFVLEWLKACERREDKYGKRPLLTYCLQCGHDLPPKD